MSEFFIPFLFGVSLGCLMGVLFRDSLQMYRRTYILVLAGGVLFALGYVVGHA